ncbi:MAG: lipopolysaccharide biosynthesis protein [Ferruginibacter sp.]|nr:lipopolysaccharide biosynthesis protein [Cytophagales bacterium]
MGQSLTSKTVQGVKWSTASTIANAVIQLGYSATMARLLEPGAYGLVSMSDQIIRFGAYFAQMGLMHALIQKKELANEDIRASFTASFGLGLLFTAFFWLVAPLAADAVFGNPQVVPILRASAFTLLFNGLAATAAGLLRRRLDFKRVAAVETASYVVGYAGVGLTCAFNGLGVWSIVYAALSQSLINALLFNFVARHDLRLLFDWQYYRPLVRYGSQSSLISFTEYFCNSFDILLIGRLLGQYPLGIYNRAFYLVYLPTYQLTHSLSKVMFSSYSQLQAQLDKLGKAYLSSIVLIAAMVLPISLGIMAASREMVLVLLGDQWTESIPVLGILCVAVPFNVLSTIPAAVCSATAHLKSKLLLKLGYVLILGGLFFLLKGYGLTGFATAVAIGEIIQTLMYGYLMHRILSIGFGSLLKGYLPGLLNGLVVAGVIFAVGTGLRSVNSPVALVFAAEVLAGGLAQTLLIFFLPHPILKVEIQKLMAKLDFSRIKNGLVNRYLGAYGKG